MEYFDKNFLSLENITISYHTSAFPIGLLLELNFMESLLQKSNIIKEAIRDIPDFPKPGIVFKDITTLLSDSKSFKLTLDLFEEKYKSKQIDYIACIESRGFIFAAPLADRLGAGLTLIRKPGKLPAETEEFTYELEYGSDTIQIHKDAFSFGRGKKVLLVDDLLATGGSASAAVELINKVSGELVGAAFVVELDFLNGREKLPKDLEIFSIVNY